MLDCWTKPHETRALFSTDRRSRLQRLLDGLLWLVAVLVIVGIFGVGVVTVGRWVIAHW